MSMNLDPKEFVKNARTFFDESRAVDNHRFRSWEHCYLAFHEAFECMKKGNEPDKDKLCLHLAFYLASWGMYRGSSFLLQCDYKVHKDAVGLILEYGTLHAIASKDLLALLEEGDDNKLVKLVEGLENSYSQVQNSVRVQQGKEKQNKVSLTLITKILLGTLGCVPAYDRYVKDALKKSGQAVWTGTSFWKSLKQLCVYYKSNCVLFDDAVNGMKMGNVICPQMKFLDMGLWRLGKPSEETE